MSNFTCFRCGNTRTSFITCPNCAVLDELKKNREQAEMFERIRREREDEERDRQIQFNRSKFNSSDDNIFQTIKFIDNLENIKIKLKQFGFSTEEVNIIVVDFLIPSASKNFTDKEFADKLFNFIELNFPHKIKNKSEITQSDTNIFESYIFLFILGCIASIPAFSITSIFNSLFSIKSPSIVSKIFFCFVVLALTFGIQIILTKSSFFNKINDYIYLFFQKNNKRSDNISGDTSLLALFSNLIKLSIFICSSFAHAFFCMFVFDTFFAIKEPGATEFFLVIFIVCFLTYCINKIDNEHGFFQALKIHLYLLGGVILCGVILLVFFGKLN